MDIGIGMIGGGFMAKSHTNAFSTIPYIFQPDYGIRRVAIGATTMEHAEAAAKRYGYEYAYADYREIIARDDVDVIDVSTSDETHKEIAIAALKAGKHVLCEKPMALNTKDAMEMQEIAAQSGTVAMMGFNYRFLPAIRLAKELIDQGALGTIYHFHGSYNQDAGANPESPVEKVWYAAGYKGSGVSLGIGSHLIDMARFLCGEITTVSGLTANHNPVRPSANGPREVLTEEEMLAVVQFESGATGELKASAISTGRKNQLTFEINGSKGSLVFDLENPSILKVFLAETAVRSVVGFTEVNVTQMDRDHPLTKYWWPRGHVLGWEHAHVNEIAHFLDCVALGTPVAPYGATFEDGVRTLQIIDAIKESGETGRRIDSRLIG